MKVQSIISSGWLTLCFLMAYSKKHSLRSALPRYPETFITSQSEIVCRLQPEQGGCGNMVKRFYYDVNKHGCHEFYYGGCNGNPNRFAERDICMKTCGKIIQLHKKLELRPEVLCRLQAESGDCHSKKIEFYFDLSGTCKQFSYGGCNGNPNKFASLDDCRSTCNYVVNTVPMPAPPNDKGNTGNTGIAMIPPYPTSYLARQPEVFCRLQPEPGDCRAMVKRWYYHLVQGCKEFNYGGCGGNLNRFPEKDKCRLTCGEPYPLQEKIEMIPEILCRLQPEPGGCNKREKRFYYDIRGNCREFQYGGCRGNPNKFSDINQCKQACKYGNKVIPPIKDNEGPSTMPKYPESFISSQVDIVCRLQPENGDCTQKSPMLYYDINERVCREFPYGGCNGNPNKFSNNDQCKKKCGGVRQIRDNLVLKPEILCRLQPEPAECRMLVPQFYYDVNEKVCKQFIYGGCNGNPHRFDTMEQCKKACNYVRRKLIISKQGLEHHKKPRNMVFSFSAVINYRI